jgi:uncharacterized protein (UPF0332 family)
MFYGLLALANLNGFASSKHQGVIGFFDREFVRSGLFPKEMSASLHNVFDLRLEADYADFSGPSIEEALSSIGRAETFVVTVEAYVRGQIVLNGN